MLILSRRPGDSVIIDGGIRIVVLGVDQRGVRLGIEAPSSIGIVREELIAEIAEENRRAAAVIPRPASLTRPPAQQRHGLEPQEPQDPAA